MLILGIIIGLIVLVILVALHEFGHAYMARRNGVVVEEFGIGLPPRAWKKKLKSGMLFTLNWLPIGGFVKLQGEHDAANKKGDYGAATFWQKTQILLAGVVVNWLIAVVLLSALALIGLPKVIPNQFSVAADSQQILSPVQVLGVKESYPAAQAGFKKGDLINKVGQVEVATTAELINQTAANKGKTVEISYQRAGQAHTKEVTLRNADTEVFGAQLGQSEKVKSTWSAPIVGVVTTGQYTWATLQGIGNLLADTVTGLFGQMTSNQADREAAAAKLGKAGESVAGPVGILGTIFPAASQAGPEQVILLAAIISLTLAVMNILPIPSLDGGRWFVTAAFKLFRKPLTKDREETIHGIGFMILLALILLITITDIFKLF